MNPELDRKLRCLRLSGIANALEARNQEAVHHQLAYPEFLELLVEDELATRRDRLFARRLKQAGILEVKSLESYDWSFNPQIPRALILDLSTARFVREHGGVLLIGPPGTGKSHIAVALTVAAIQAGHTALYRSAFDLAQEDRKSVV
jgi:DNA replication protein DnaC